MKATDSFRDAEALAEFANLKQTDSAAVAYFRNNYPDFAPAEWWDYNFQELDFVPVPKDDPDFKGTDIKASLRTEADGALSFNLTPVWHVAHESVQQAWEDRFQFETIYGLTQLLKMVFTAPAEMVLNDSYLDLTDGEMWVLSAAKAYGFHTGVLYLREHPKQVKVCAECGKYFVTVHGKREFCLYPDFRGETCSQRRISQQHLNWWRTHGDAQRKARQKQKQKQTGRLPGSQRKRALR